MNRVKPCPFCGGENVAVRIGEKPGWRYAQCTRCGAAGPEIRPGRAEERAADTTQRAAEAWNKREGQP
jgi:Lar family restriction alleviation protein